MLALALGICAVTAVAVTGFIISSTACDEASWQAAAASEAEAIAPPGARDPVTTTFGCDAHLYRQFDVGDNAAALNAMNESALAQGWKFPTVRSTASPSCLEKAIDGQPSIMFFGSNAPNSVTLETWTGTCDNH